MSDITLVYYTDNILQEDIMFLCQKNILWAAEGKRIISVSQKPIDFGENICVGEIGKNILSLYKQIMIGVAEVKTKYVALVEHDCIYNPEHFEWQVPTDRKFYYNINHWFVDWNTCQYSYYRRKVISMMLCNTELLQRVSKDRVYQLENNLPSTKDFGKDKRSYRAVAFRTRIPNIDIRHDNNFSGLPRVQNRCYNIFYWGKFSEIKQENL